MAATTVTVGCKLPSGLCAEVGEQSIIFNGINSSMIEGGFGLTEGVDSVFWKTWLEQNKDMPFVKNGFVFAHSQSSSLKAEIKEKAGEKTGLEPLNPKKKPDGIKDLEK